MCGSKYEREVSTISFDEVYREQAKLVFSYLYAKCNDYHLAEDLTQETFLRAYKHRKEFSEKNRLSSWLCEIAKNIYVDYIRKRVPQPVEEDELAQLPTPESELDLSYQHVIKLAHKLEDPYKEVFMLHYNLDLSYKEIGEIFDKSEGWVRLIFYRAKARLKQLLEEEQE